MFLTLRGRLTRIWRLTALRQAVILTGCFMGLLALAGLFSILQFQRVFEDRIEAELTARMAVVSADLADGGLDAAEYPWSGTERIVFVQTRRALRPGFYNDWEFGPRPRGAGRNGDDWMYLVRNAEGGQLVVGTNVGRRDEFIEVILQSMGIVGLSAAVIALLFGLGLGLRAQARLTAITTTLRRAATGDLTARVASPTDRDDLDDLAGQLDDTIEHLDRLMRQTRDFAGNIAHDLKTPLARLRLRLENALLAETDHGDSADEIGAALEQTDDVIAIFDAFLRVAKLEAGTAKATFEPVDLGALVDQIAEIYGPVIEDGGRSLTVDRLAPATVPGDRVLLTQMLANLIENAIRYTPKGAKIRLVARGYELGLADNGPGIPEAEYTRVVQPLYRLDKSRSEEGAGLGLALVKTIANVHDAQLILSPDPAAKGAGLLIRAVFSKNP